MRTGLHQLLRQRAIIRHQQQSLARIIQPSHRIHAPHTLRQQIHHRRPPFGIADRGHISLRLIQQKIDQPLRLPQPLAIHANLIALRIRLPSLLRHHYPIQRHPARRNHLFRLAPRRNPAPRHYLLQSFHHFLECGGLPALSEANVPPFFFLHKARLFPRSVPLLARHSKPACRR